MQSNNKSGYKGVSWFKDTQKWCAKIKFKGEMITIGYFLDKKEAALAYNKMALKYYGKFAKLNLIE